MNHRVSRAYAARPHKHVARSESEHLANDDRLPHCVGDFCVSPDEVRSGFFERNAHALAVMDAIRERSLIA